MTYTAAELEGLTPDELEALVAEQAPEAEALAAVAAESVVAEEPAAQVAEAAATEPAEPQAVATPQPETPNEVVDEAGRVQQTFQADLPADIGDQRKALRAEESEALKTYQKAVRERMMDGRDDFDDLDAVYLEVKNRVADQLEALTRAETTADVSKRIAAQNYENAWSELSESFIRDTKAKEGIDYLADAELMAEINRLVPLFYHEAIGQGMPDDRMQASRYALQQAHATVKLRHDLKPAVATPAPAAAPAVETKPRAPEPTVRTIGNLPAAAQAPVGDDLMARLGSLEGEELERAFARLSPADVDKLTRMAS